MVQDSCFDGEKTKESSECLKHLTQKAVKFQKTMNQLSKGEKVIYLPPLQVNPSLLASTLSSSFLAQL